MRKREAVKSLLKLWTHVYKKTGSAASEANICYWLAQLLEIDNA